MDNRKGDRVMAVISKRCEDCGRDAQWKIYYKLKDGTVKPQFDPYNSAYIGRVLVVYNCLHIEVPRFNDPFTDSLYLEGATFQ